MNHSVHRLRRAVFCKANLRISTPIDRGLPNLFTRLELEWFSRPHAQPANSAQPESNWHFRVDSIEYGSTPSPILADYSDFYLTNMENSGGLLAAVAV